MHLALESNRRIQHQPPGQLIVLKALRGIQLTHHPPTTRGNKIYGEVLLARKYEAVQVPLADHGHYTPSTAMESYAHTPAPMKTPVDTSFSRRLEYIDQKLLDHLASLPENQSTVPLFPPGLEPEPKVIVLPLSQAPTLIELENQFINYPRSKRNSGTRRTYSKALREEFEHSPPEANDSSLPEIDAKRRKLCRHESTSAHTFMTTESASLRKAKSLLAGNVAATPQSLTTIGLPGFQVPPIFIPAISQQAAAANRLRMLFSREAKQRTEDTQLMIDAERPDSLMIDDDLRSSMVEWLLSVKGPAGYECKPLRRHLRASLETRFHAVWLFGRYAIRLPDARFNPFLTPYGGQEDPYQVQLRERLVREIALACLAVAAKFHHDFLPPLKPITADQFLCMFDEGQPVAFDDFELIQKKILKSFNYVVYQPTPQAYLQEIWEVSSSLQVIQDTGLKLYRTEVQARTLELIETCLHEQESMSYPVFHLAAGSLLEALHIEELHQQCALHTLSGNWECEPLGQTRGPDSCEGHVCVACVSNQICDALVIPQNTILSCRDWIMTIWVGEIANS
ncbi:hypothetical protein RhiJN_14822 [Ceratobasidium sp. AG-Ba]|nr:hypothetical protein RhiJN_14822 [Ceratobasidium sp. AG-Ba]QRW15358.1 hypothetical protein RhiLY_14357 [Ceratobasidium sp. AG-Ba]